MNNPARRTPVWVLIVCALLMNYCVGIEFLAIPKLTLYLGGGTAELGYMMGIPPIFYVIVCFTCSHLGDRFKAATILVPAALIYALFNIPFAMVAWRSPGNEPHLLWGLYVCRTLTSIGMALFWPPFERHLAEGKTPQELTRTLRWFNVSWCTGLTVGLWSYGPLSQWVGEWTFPALGRLLPFAAMIACGIVTIVVVLAGFSHTVHAEEGGESAAEPISEGVRRERYAHLTAARVANLACYTVTSGILALFPELARAKGIDDIWLSNINMARGAMEMLTFFVLGSTMRFLYKRRKIVTAMLLCSTGTVLVAVGEGIPVYIIGFAMIGVATGITYVAAITYSLHDHDDKSAKGGVHEGVLGSGYILGPLICSQAGVLCATISPYWGLRAPYWTGAAIPLLLLALLAVLPSTRAVFKIGK